MTKKLNEKDYSYKARIGSKAFGVERKTKDIFERKPLKLYV